MKIYSKIIKNLNLKFPLNVNEKFSVKITPDTNRLWGVLPIPFLDIKQTFSEKVNVETFSEKVNVETFSEKVNVETFSEKVITHLGYMLSYRLDLVSVSKAYNGINNGILYVSYNTVPIDVKSVFELIKGIFKVTDSILPNLSTLSLLPVKQYHYFTNQKANIFVNEPYMICRMIKSKFYTMNFTDKRATLMCNSNTYTVPYNLDGTSVLGEWYAGVFTIYDITMYKHKNVSKKSLLSRIRILEKNIPNILPQIKLVKYKICGSKSLDKIKDLANNYGGILFTPVRAGVINNRTYVYQHPKDVLFNFEVKAVKEIVTTYKIFCEDSTLFFNNNIALSLDDKIYVGYSNTVRLAWINNSFIPVQHVTRSSLTTLKDAKKRWFYINNHINILIVLTLFKKCPK